MKGGGFNPNSAYTRDEEDPNVLHLKNASKKPKKSGLTDAAEVFDLGSRRMAAKDPYKDEKPSTWTCDEHHISGIKDGNECPKCKKERERVEKEQDREASQDRKRA